MSATDAGFAGSAGASPGIWCVVVVPLMVQLNVAVWVSAPRSEYFIAAVTFQPPTVGTVVNVGSLATGATLATVTWKVLARLLAPVPFSSTTVRVTV